MHRRHLIFAGFGLACSWHASLSQAHTLYNQWVVYRRKHLLIGSHREDLQTYSLAKNVTSILQDNLPTANSRVARAPTAGRIASLLATDQMDVALLPGEQAVRMANGADEFKPYGKIELKTLFSMSDYILVCRDDMPDKHSWLISHALTGSALDKKDTVNPPLPWHQGALMYRSGKPLP